MIATYRSKHGMHSFSRPGGKTISFTPARGGHGILITDDLEVQEIIEKSIHFQRGTIVKVEEPVKKKKGLLARIVDSTWLKYG